MTPECLLPLHAIAAMGKPELALDLFQRLWQRTPWIRDNQSPPLWATGASLQLVEHCLNLTTNPQVISLWTGFTEHTVNQILAQLPTPNPDAPAQQRRNFNQVEALPAEPYAPFPSDTPFHSVLSDLEAARGLATARRILLHTAPSTRLREIDRAHDTLNQDLATFLNQQFEKSQSPPFLPLLKSTRIPGTRPAAAYTHLAALCLDAGFPQAPQNDWTNILLQFLEQEDRLWNGIARNNNSFQISASNGIANTLKRQNQWDGLSRFFLSLSAIAMDPANHFFQDQVSWPIGPHNRRLTEIEGINSIHTHTEDRMLHDLAANGLFLSTLRDLIVSEEFTHDGSLTGKLLLMPGAPESWWNGLDTGPILTAFGPVSITLTPDADESPIQFQLRFTPNEASQVRHPLEMVRLCFPKEGWISAATRTTGAMKGRSTPTWIEFKPVADTVLIELTP